MEQKVWYQSHPDSEQKTYDLVQHWQKKDSIPQSKNPRGFEVCRWRHRCRHIQTIPRGKENDPVLPNGGGQPHIRDDNLLTWNHFMVSIGIFQYYLEDKKRNGSGNNDSQ